MSDLDDYYQHAPLAKPIPRKRLKAPAKREKRDKTAKVREHAQTREAWICRCCRHLQGQSMHEILSRGAGGKVSKANSIWVCGELGNDTAFCHGLLQTGQIEVGPEPHNADELLVFTPITPKASEHMRVPLGFHLLSPPTHQIRGESE